MYGWYHRKTTILKEKNNQCAIVYHLKDEAAYHVLFNLLFLLIHRTLIHLALAGL